MTTSGLISFIRKQIQNNVSKDLIISKLIGVGWRREDIDEGFLSIDRYREQPVEDNIIEVKKELPKIEVFNIEDKKVELPIIETPKIEIPKMEVPKIEIPLKVWAPMSVPIKEIVSKDILVSQLEPEIKKEETTKIEIQNLELPPEKPVSNENKEILPTLTPKAVFNSFNSIKGLSKIPMLSSYRSDLLSVSKEKEEIVKKKNYKIIKWIIFALIICTIAFFIWVFASGYINIKNLNIPFIKKDPKVLLLNNSKVLSSLKSYKTETNIEISSPSFANITSGLITGEAISSLDKDSISINTLGSINKNEQGLLSDNFVTIKSSVLQDYITTDIKNNGSDLFISVPDLSQIIKENVPEPSVVKINEQQFDLILPLFFPNIELALRKINIYKILSSGIPSYINNETLNAYEELINSVEIIGKGQENIKGIDTYHYSINADRQLAKNLLSKISDNFVVNLLEGDKEKLIQILGSVMIDSFEVWIGKGDNNIYQFNVVLDIPLSKIIGFEDKSIGDNQINIAWKTTYYDFDVNNNLSIPDTSTSVTDFVYSIKKEKIKNDVSSFKQLADDLFKVEKSYGKKSNSSGSCMNPTSGSLFSPTEHTKSAVTAVSSLSELLNKILKTTGDAGFCYSTTKAWSFTIPISDNYDSASIPAEGFTSFFCVDSTGSMQDLITPPTGVVCLPEVDLTKAIN